METKANGTNGNIEHMITNKCVNNLCLHTRKVFQAIRTDVNKYVIFRTSSTKTSCNETRTGKNGLTVCNCGIHITFLIKYFHHFDNLGYDARKPGAILNTEYC